MENDIEDFLLNQPESPPDDILESLNKNLLNEIEPPSYDPNMLLLHDAYIQQESQVRRFLGDQIVEDKKRLLNCQYIGGEYDRPRLPTFFELFKLLTPINLLEKIYFPMEKYDWNKFLNCWKKRDTKEANDELIIQQNLAFSQLRKFLQKHPDLYAQYYSHGSN